MMTKGFKRFFASESPAADISCSGTAVAKLADWLGTIHALIVRDIRSRFSGDPLGYGWAFVTPLVWIGSIALVFSLIGRHPPILTDVISFLIAGMLPYTVFRITITSTMRSLKAQRYMPYFAHISKVDILLASALLEFVNAIVVYLVLLSINALVFSHFEMADPVMTFFGFSIAWALGASFGHLAAVFTEISGATVRVVPIILRPMFWISGIFFVANEMPGGFMKIMQYNPLLQAIEIMRTGVFLDYTSRYIDIIIPFIYIFGLNIAAMMARFYASERHRG